MWKNNFKIAFRILWKDKFYSLISILGLAVSIAFCLLMTMYLENEFTYDEHHKDAQNVYRLVFDNYENMGPYASTPHPIGPALQEDFPEIEAMSRLSHGFKSLARYNNNSFFETLSFVDSGIVDIFNMEFIYGNPEEALSQPNQIIISESAAQKYFGNSNPIGKVLDIGSSGSLNSTVTAVFRDFPQNMHIRFDLAMPYATFAKVWGTPNLWQQMPKSYTYFRLREGQQSTDLAAKLPAFSERHVGKEVENPDQNYKMNIQPITAIHLHSKLQNEVEPNGDIMSLYLLGCIALLVLIIACINYINYATARFSKRAKEVGVRKIIGAARSQLISQFLLETILIALVAGLFALFLAQVLIPVFNGISGKSFVIADFRQWLIFGSLGLLILLIAIGAGIFPALFLSAFKPIEVLKGKFSNLSLPNISRKYLVTTQFVASIILLISTIVVYSQMQYALAQFQSGPDEQIVLFQSNSKINEKFSVLKEELLKQPGVLSVTAGSNMPTFYGDSWSLMTALDAHEVQTETYAIENDFLQTLDYQLIAGRDLDKNRQEDKISGFIINEAAMRKLGFENPDDALGKTLYWGGDNKKNGYVTGIIKDFHFQSLHEEIKPAVLLFQPYEWMTNNFIAAKIEVDQFTAIQKSIQQQVAHIDPKWLADVKFLDANFQSIHQKDIQQGRIFGAFALLAIIISCLGLLGLAAFATERRSKEISIRKVLGASVSNLMGLLSGEFVTLVIVALIFAIPASWLLMNSWLSNFVYRIDMQWWMFAISGFIVILIALLTVGFQCAKAALSNPVNALKSE